MNKKQPYQSVVLLVLAVAVYRTTELVTLANQFKTYGGDLKALCKGRQTDFRNVGDLRNLVYKLDSEDAENCPEMVTLALRDLELITRDTNACSVQKALAITQYYETYLRNTSGSEEYEDLPKPLVRFAIAYGMRLNHVCNRYLIDKFVYEAERLLTKRDFQELDEWIGEKGPIGRLLGPIKRPDEIILPSDLSVVMPDDRVIQKLRLKLVEGGKVNRLKEVCAKRFKPLYEHNVIPLAILANSGLGYRQVSLIKDFTLRSKAVPRVALWSRIVFLCESLESVEVKEALVVPQQQQSVDDVLADEAQNAASELAADELRKATQPELRPKPTFMKRATMAKQPYDLQQLDYSLPQAKINDEIMGHFDLRIKSIIYYYNRSKTEAQRTKERLIRGAWRLLLARFKYGEVKALIKVSVRKLKVTLKRKGKTEMFNEELADLLDAKEETRLFRVINKMCNTKESLMAWMVVTLLRFFMGFVIAAIVISGLGHDKVDSLNDELRKYNT